MTKKAMLSFISDEIDKEFKIIEKHQDRLKKLKELYLTVKIGEPQGGMIPLCYET